MATYQALEALADPTRRAIFESLRDGPRSVVEITGCVPISRPAVSQHLKVLKTAHLVSVRPVGTRRYYAVDPAGLAELRSYFEQFWSAALQAYATSFTDPIEETEHDRTD